MSSVTVVTPAIDTRFHLLQECMESVRNQTHKPAAHFISVDYDRIGAAKTLNNLIDAVQTEWFAPVADDDLFLPQHLERLLSVSDDADMIYPWCKVTGRNWNPNSKFDAKRLLTDNYIPSTVLMRKSVWAELGGYPDVVCEDHAMWVLMLQHNKTIKCLPEITWEYRFEATPDHRNISNGFDPKAV